MADPSISSTVHSTPAKYSLRVVDACLAVLICLLPFVMGGREAWGHWLLVTTAGLLATSWCVYAMITKQRYQFGWLELFAIAGCAVVVLQLMPLAEQQIQAFSPEYQRLLTEWSTSQDAHGRIHWSTLSLTPSETMHGLVIFAAYSVIAIVGWQRIQSADDCGRILYAVAITGLAMAGFAVIQWVSSNGKFFWVYEHPFTDPTEHLKGAFTNRNHFAHLLAISLGPLLWWLVQNIRAASDAEPVVATKNAAERVMPVILLLAGVAGVCLCILLSLSRGGMIAGAVTVLLAAVGFRKGLKLSGTVTAVVLGTACVVLAVLAVVDEQQVQNRIEQLISGELDQMDGGGVRRAVWAADAKVIERFPWMGTGVGSHRDVYAIYMENYADFGTFEMTHAESSYVHLAVETGLAGTALLAAFLIWLFLRLFTGWLQTKDYERRAMIVAVATSAAGAVIHAVTDFVWYVPSIVVISLLLGVAGLKAAAFRNCPKPTKTGLRMPRVVWGTAATVMSLMMAACQPGLLSRASAEHHWYASLKTELKLPFRDDDDYADLKAGDTITLKDQLPSEIAAQKPAPLSPEEIQSHADAELAYLKTRLIYLKQCLAAQPDHHRAQLAMAESLLRYFDLVQGNSENPMPLSMLRDASARAGFQTQDELKTWLQAVCEQRLDLLEMADSLFRRTLRQCPVQGYAYSGLLKTAFLKDTSGQLADRYLKQALTVRGHDPRLQFVAGQEALMEGDQQTALKYLSSVFHSSQHFRVNLLQKMAAQTSAGFFLEQFQPDSEELLDVLSVYSILNSEPDIVLLKQNLCQQLPDDAEQQTDPDEKLRLMLLASQFALELEEHGLAIRLLDRTIHEFPASYEAHHRLGVAFFNTERFQDALVHLKWCHEWDPGSEWVPEMIRISREKLVEMAEHPNQSPVIQQVSGQRQTLFQ